MPAVLLIAASRKCSEGTLLCSDWSSFARSYRRYSPCPCDVRDTLSARIGVPMTRKAAFTVLTLIAILVPFSIAQSANNASSVFHKIQALAGEWEGKDDSGNVSKTKFELVAGNTAVLETLTMAGMEEMLTLYTVDGNGIALVHYCPTNNQPRMRTIPSSGDVKELVFSFQGATNLPDLSVGHQHKLVLEFTGPDQIVERWTWRKDGKDTEMVHTFRRTQSAKK